MTLSERREGSEGGAGVDLQALQFAALRNAVGLSQQEACAWLDVRDDTMRNWTTGRRAVPAGVIERFRALARQQEELARQLAPAMTDGLSDMVPHLITTDDDAVGRGWPTAKCYNLAVARAWAMARNSAD